MKQQTTLLLSALLFSLSFNSAAQPPQSMEVHKDPNCGCCKAWIAKLPSQTKITVVHPKSINTIKDSLGIDKRYRACHTAITKDGFIFEGHVPNSAMSQFLAAPPAGAVGLAVPGMPVGSQGMEVGEQTMRYPIVQLNRTGPPTLYSYGEGSKMTP